MSDRQPNDLPTWDLSDLFSSPDDPKLEDAIASMSDHAKRFSDAYKGRIAVEDLAAETLREALVAYEELVKEQQKPYSFARLLFSTNTSDPARGALMQRAQEAGSIASTHLIFFDLEIGAIPQETYDRIIEAPSLAAYRHYLDHQRQLAKHRLTEAEERILEETANTRGRAFTRLFTEVSSRRKFKLDGDELTQSQLLAKFHDPDRETRRKTAEALTAGVAADTHVVSYIFNTLLYEKQTMDRLRSFKNPEDSRHLGNEVDGAVVQTVVDVCVKNDDIVARYYNLKRRLLGLDELTHYDRYAPITGDTTSVPFDEAKRLVLEAFGQFSERLTQITEPFFSRRWIDAALADGKQGGAYCSALTPDLHPYVFMNYTGTPRDVMTLAHELGHGAHDVLASKQSLVNYHPVLPLAETASTFGEMLVFDKLQATLESDEERLALLCGKIEDTFATVFRQIAMYRFEQKAHRARREQGERTPDDYAAIWQASQQEMFGDSLTLGDEHRWWWLYIPHVFHAPFYVYAYAFGELLVLSLYALYQRVGKEFVPRYFDLLEAGGSQEPAAIISKMGFDIASADFWQAGCDLIREKVEEAEALAEQIGKA